MRRLDFIVTYTTLKTITINTWALIWVKCNRFYCKIRFSTMLKTEQQYLNTTTKRALNVS